MKARFAKWLYKLLWDHFQEIREVVKKHADDNDWVYRSAQSHPEIRTAIHNLEQRLDLTDRRLAAIVRAHNGEIIFNGYGDYVLTGLSDGKRKPLEHRRDKR